MGQIIQIQYQKLFAPILHTVQNKYVSKYEFVFWYICATQKH